MSKNRYWRFSTSSSNSGSTTPSTDDKKEETTTPSKDEKEANKQEEKAVSTKSRLATELVSSVYAVKNGVYYNKKENVDSVGISHIKTKDGFVRTSDGQYHTQVIINKGDERALIDAELYGARYVNGEWKYYHKYPVYTAEEAATFKFDSNTFYKVSDSEYHYLVEEDNALEFVKDQNGLARYGVVFEKDYEIPHYYDKDSTVGGDVYEVNTDNNAFLATDGYYYQAITVYDAGKLPASPKDWEKNWDVVYNTTKAAEGVLADAGGAPKTETNKKKDAAGAWVDNTTVYVKRTPVPVAALTDVKLKGNFKHTAEGKIYDTTTVSAAGYQTYVVDDNYDHAKYIGYTFISNEGYALLVSENDADIYETGEVNLGKWVEVTIDGKKYYREVICEVADAGKDGNYKSLFVLSDDYELVDGIVIKKDGPKGNSGADATTKGLAKLSDNPAGFINVADAGKYYNTVGAGKNFKREVTKTEAMRVKDGIKKVVVDGKTIYYNKEIVDLDTTNVENFVAKPGFVKGGQERPTFYKEATFEEAFDANRFGKMRNAANKLTYYYADTVDKSAATETMVGIYSADEFKYVIDGTHAYPVVPASEALKYDSTKEELKYNDVDDKWYIFEK